MFSNTENSSANDSVNTRPKLKAYFGFISFVKANQQRIALAIGYVLVALLFFGLGQFTNQKPAAQVRIEEPQIDLTKVYDKLNSANPQLSQEQGGVAGDTTANCEGKIKGNISSSSKIYHLPGGAFYKRTVPEMCFDTESQAQSAGFRKSKL